MESNNLQFTKRVALWTGGVLLAAFIAILAYAYVWPLFTEKTANEAPPPTSDSTHFSDGTGANTPPTKNGNTPGTQPKAAKPTTVKTGTFSGQPGKSAGGNVTIGQNYIRLEQNFYVQNAPDLFVYVGTASDPVAEIARLKANKGGQNYSLPQGMQAGGITHVWIYCKAFDQNYASAAISGQ